MDDIHFSQRIGVEGFPSLILLEDEKYRLIHLDYNHVEPMLAQIIKQKLL